MHVTILIGGQIHVKYRIWSP